MPGSIGLTSSSRSTARRGVPSPGGARAADSEADVSPRTRDSVQRAQGPAGRIGGGHDPPARAVPAFGQRRRGSRRSVERRMADGHARICRRAVDRPQVGGAGSSHVRCRRDGPGGRGRGGCEQEGGGRDQEKMKRATWHPAHHPIRASTSRPACRRSQTGRRDRDRRPCRRTGLDRRCQPGRGTVARCGNPLSVPARSVETLGDQAIQPATGGLAETATGQSTVERSSREGRQGEDRPTPARCGVRSSAEDCPWEGVGGSDDHADPAVRTGHVTEPNALVRRRAPASPAAPRR